MSPRRAAALSAGDRTLREHLIATAERMLSERGATGLTVRAIAREAGVADGVLYNHFADKEELLAHALWARAESLTDGLGPLPEAGTATVGENLRAHVERGMTLHDGLLPALAGLLGHPEVLERFSELSEGHESWRDQLADYLRAELVLGRLASAARVDAAVSMIVGACHEAVLSALVRGGTLTRPLAPEAADELVGAILDGIGLR